MTQTTHKNYRFTLPGPDETRLQAIAYNYGLEAITMIFLQSNDASAAQNASGFIMNVPMDEKDITQMAEETCQLLLKEGYSDGLHVTNEPLLYADIYNRNFIEGYRFGLYASSLGLIKALTSIPTDQRYNTAFIFSWNLFHPDAQEEIPPSLATAVHKIEQLHRRFNRESPQK